MTICSLESLNSARGWEGIIRIALHGAQPRESTMDQRGDSTMSIFFLNCSSKLILKILWIILDGMVALEHLWQDSLRFLQIDNQTALYSTHRYYSPINLLFAVILVMWDWYLTETGLEVMSFIPMGNATSLLFSLPYSLFSFPGCYTSVLNLQDINPAKVESLWHSNLDWWPPLSLLFIAAIHSWPASREHGWCHR